MTTKIDHSKDSLHEALGLKSSDVHDLVKGFSLSVTIHGSLSKAVEDILVKLNNLEGEDKTTYWHTMLYLMFRGIKEITDEVLHKSLSGIDDLISALKKAKNVEVVHGTADEIEKLSKILKENIEEKH